mmetsp:Transcript_13664/g.15709  ORF Transcript_13664/g.15709 Transcript_13664/m.15709 type:complete len:581 (-) Transcript_13664:303-2045(-)
MMPEEVINMNNNSNSNCGNKEIKEEIVAVDKQKISESSNNEEWTNLNDNNIHHDLKDGDGDDGVNFGPKTNTNTIPTSSNHSVGSIGSITSGNIKKKVIKRRGWKKPKDKPKRPLSAYNIFFKHTRSRIVEGLPEEGSVGETIQSIEDIVANSTEKKKNRKTHGQISFGDLARKIADQWKMIGKDQKALFVHYASLDMKRYRREVAIWKAKKEQAKMGGGTGIDTMDCLEMSGNSSYSSGSCFSDLNENMDNLGNSISSHDEWAPRYRTHDSLSSSFHSADSEFSSEPVPIADIEILDNIIQSKHQGNQQSQQEFVSDNLNNSIPNVLVVGQGNTNSDYGHCVPSFIFESSGMQQHNNMSPPATSSADSDINGKKLHEIWEKNRQLEESINQLKQELSSTNFLGGSGDNNSSTSFGGGNSQLKQQQQMSGLNAPLTGGPSIDRMQSLHRRRQLIQNNPLRDFVVGGNGFRMGNITNSHHPNQGSNDNNYSINDNHNNNGSQPLELEEGFESPVIRKKKSIPQRDTSMTPMSTCELSPVPFEQVFSKDTANMKRKEMINNISNLDLLSGEEQIEKERENTS